jgi:hypothetical protein
LEFVTKDRVGDLAGGGEEASGEKVVGNKHGEI